MATVPSPNSEMVAGSGAATSTNLKFRPNTPSETPASTLGKANETVGLRRVLRDCRNVKPENVCDESAIRESASLGGTKAPNT